MQTLWNATGTQRIITLHLKVGISSVIKLSRTNWNWSRMMEALASKTFHLSSNPKLERVDSYCLCIYGHVCTNKISASLFCVSISVSLSLFPALLTLLSLVSLLILLINAKN